MVPRDSRIKGMHRASFFAGGRYVVTTGEKTDLLSIYDVSTGTVIATLRRQEHVYTCFRATHASASIALECVETRLLSVCLRSCNPPSPPARSRLEMLVALMANVVQAQQ